MLSCSTHITALSVSSLKRHFEKRVLHTSFVHQIRDYFARSRFYDNQKVWLIHLRLWTYSKRLLQARFFFLPTLTASCNYQAKGNAALASLYCWTMAAFFLAFMQKKRFAWSLYVHRKQMTQYHLLPGKTKLGCMRAPLRLQGLQ